MINAVKGTLFKILLFEVWAFFIQINSNKNWRQPDLNSLTFYEAALTPNVQLFELEGAFLKKKLPQKHLEEVGIEPVTLG